MRGARRTLVYAPTLSTLGGPVQGVLASADVLLVDGTFYHPDELLRLGLGSGSAASMGHLAICQSAGPLSNLPARTELYTHLNNTNPAIDPASPERAWICAHGLEGPPLRVWAVGHVRGRLHRLPIFNPGPSRQEQTAMPWPSAAGTG